MNSTCGSHTHTKFARIFIFEGGRLNPKKKKKKKKKGKTKQDRACMCMRGRRYKATVPFHGFHVPDAFGYQQASCWCRSAWVPRSRISTVFHLIQNITDNNRNMR